LSPAQKADIVVSSSHKSGAIGLKKSYPAVYFTIIVLFASFILGFVNFVTLRVRRVSGWVSDGTTMRDERYVLDIIFETGSALSLASSRT
jgi:hypothetical protein